MFDEESFDDDTSAIQFELMSEPELRGFFDSGLDAGESGTANLIINYLPLDIYSVDLKVSLRYLTWIE